MHSPSHHSFENTLAFHCAPVLLGVKSANLVSFCNRIHDDLEAELLVYGAALEPCAFHFEQLCCCENRTLVLVYRKELLSLELCAPGVAAFLHRLGYPAAAMAGPEIDLSAMLLFLKKRMESCSGFSHEIGLFLGYPLADVLGFIRNEGRNFLLNGYWKVYSDAEQRKKTFEKYTACREFLCRRISEGNRLIPLLSAETA